MNNVERVTVLLVCLLADAGRALALLDYIAGDYQAALASPQEMQEQIGFAGDAAREAPEFASEIQTLQRRIESRAAPVEVAATARNLALRVAQKYQLAVLPRRPPDVRRGRALYQQACAACHENARLSLSPPAPAFIDRSYVARRRDLDGSPSGVGIGSGDDGASGGRS